MKQIYLTFIALVLSCFGVHAATVTKQQALQACCLDSNADIYISEGSLEDENVLAYFDEYDIMDILEYCDPDQKGYS